MSESTDSTQPITVKKKPSRLRARLLSALGVVVLLALSIFGGARAAIGDREAALKTQIGSQLAEQFQYALVDINYGRYDAAKQRLEYIIAHDSGYPGAAQKLTEVMVAMSVPTATSTPLPTPTPNPSGAEGIFAQAQQLIAAGDWANALVAIDLVRKADPNYRTGEVDGMYYFVLRNYGFSMIVQQGNLEGGIYELTRAERFGPLDNSANGLREGARAYITAASFWEINWEQAVAYLSQVASGWPSLWDGTMTASQRFRIASMRYGDELVAKGQFCDAVQQYQNASAIGELDADAAKGYNQAFQACYPATATATPTGLVTAVTPGDTAVATTEPAPVTTEPPPTEPPTEPPTQAPTTNP
jgi:tetratricopeptide (TPR) repeat protein